MYILPPPKIMRVIIHEFTRITRISIRIRLQLVFQAQLRTDAGYETVDTCTRVRDKYWDETGGYGSER